MIAAIELGILDALKDASDDGKLGYAWSDLKPFPNNLSEYLQNSGKVRVPAAFVAWVNSSDSQDNDDEAGVVSTHRFVLAVVAQNQRNPEQPRHGDGAIPGSYQLTEDAARVLSGNWLEPVDLERPISIVSFAPLQLAEDLERQNFAAVAIVLECRAGVGVFEEVFGTFRQLHADWDVTPFGNVTPPLPAENPDAEDLIEVPQ